MVEIIYNKEEKKKTGQIIDFRLPRNIRQVQKNIHRRLCIDVFKETDRAAGDGGKSGGSARTV